MPTPSPEDTTRLLRDTVTGQRQAADELMTVVYDELRCQARRRFEGESPRHTLQPTALVNEVYLRLINQTQVQWQDRAHFCAIAAHMMRRVLVDHARGKGRIKRGHGRPAISLDEKNTLSPSNELDVLMVDDALETLAQLDSRQAEIVELRFFGGLTTIEVAEVLGVSERTVRNDWKMARAWLRQQLGEASDS